MNLGDQKELIEEKVLKNFPPTMGRILKSFTGKGPERINIDFLENVILVNIFGVVNKAIFHTTFFNDPNMVDTVRNYYYRLMKSDRERIDQFFLQNCDIKVEQVFCDFDIMANEAVFVFRYKI